MTVTRRAAITGAAAALAMTPAVASTISADPVLILAEGYREANRRCEAASIALDRAEEAARNRGCYPTMPSMTVGTQFCLDAEQVREAAAEVGFDAERQRELVELMNARLANYRAQRRAAGLVSFEQEVEAAEEARNDTLGEVVRTSAATAAGLAEKIRLLVAEFKDGNSEHGNALAESALADALRLARAG